MMHPMAPVRPPVIVCASSHVAFGAVGNRIMVPALQALGCRVIEIATVTLSWHPGMMRHWSAPSRQVADIGDFAALCRAISAAPFAANIAGIVTGYLGDARQAGILSEMITTIKTANPHAIHLCDPVIGDGGGLYVPEEVATAILDTLHPHADVVTPNLFEHDWLKRRGPGFKGRLATIITSAAQTDGRITLHLDANGHRSSLSHPAYDTAPNGTGDLFAALLTGHLALGAGLLQAATRAAAAVASAVEAAQGATDGMIAIEAMAEFVTADHTTIALTEIP
jgi:pyridoxine kinase